MCMPIFPGQSVSRKELTKEISLAGPYAKKITKHHVQEWFHQLSGLIRTAGRWATNLMEASRWVVIGPPQSNDKRLGKVTWREEELEVEIFPVKNPSRERHCYQRRNTVTDLAIVLIPVKPDGIKPHPVQVRLALVCTHCLDAIQVSVQMASENFKVTSSVGLH